MLHPSYPCIMLILIETISTSFSPSLLRPSYSFTRHIYCICMWCIRGHALVPTLLCFLSLYHNNNIKYTNLNAHLKYENVIKIYQTTKIAFICCCCCERSLETCSSIVGYWWENCPQVYSSNWFELIASMYALCIFINSNFRIFFVLLLF